MHVHIALCSMMLYEQQSSGGSLGILILTKRLPPPVATYPAFQIFDQAIVILSISLSGTANIQEICQST